MKRGIFYIPLIIFIWGCSKTSMTDSISTSETQRQREVCLDWYGYRIDTKKAISDLNPVSYTHLTLPTTPYV